MTPPSVGGMRTHTGGSRAQRGQAAVETAAMATVVALLLAATTAWLVATLRPPPAPPDVIGRVAAPVLPPGTVTAPAIPAPRPLTAILGLPAGTHPSEPIGRALRAVAEGVVVVARARQAFVDGFDERAAERFREILHDPVAELLAAPDVSLLTPSGMGRRLARQAAADAAALREYVRRLRAMPASEAVVTASHDAGRQSADGAIRVLEALLRKKAVGGPSRPAPPRAPRRAP